ncbi:MFS transporter [Thermobaculum terrenum]
MRLSYWWWFAAIGSFTPFVSLYCRDLGLSGIEIGLLTAMTAMGTAFLAPMWAHSATSTRCTNSC